ncbi:hypothetical protein KCP77_11925 [Salmonella enterica subsp. enterica]|nr:hypothetical protein KCP77_11925 [Salmonella enterica subsp. enterica]
MRDFATLAMPFPPAINEVAEAVMPTRSSARHSFARILEPVQSVAKFGAALLAVGLSIGSPSRAVKILEQCH